MSASAIERYMDILDKVRLASSKVTSAQSDFAFRKMEEVHNIVHEKKYWTSAQAWTNLLGGFGQGGLGLVATLMTNLSPTAGKIVEAVSKALPLVAQSAVSYIEGQKVMPQHKESYFLQTVAQKLQKMESSKQLEKELQQTFLQILQIRTQMLNKGSDLNR